MIDWRHAVLVAVLVISVMGVAGAATGTLQLQAAEGGDQDRTTLSYTFTAAGNGTATVDPVSESQSGGDVTFDLQTASSFTVQDGEQYTVDYEVTATDGASEGTYSIYSTVSGPGATHNGEIWVNVDILEPKFGTVGTQSGEVTFTTDQTESTSLDVAVPNTGDGVMTGISPSASGYPEEMSVSFDTPAEIRAGDEATLTVDVAAEDSLSEGTYRFSVTVTDSLGNEEQFPVEITVHKPPVLAAQEETVDLGEILVGGSESTSFVLEEVGGEQSIDGVDLTTDVDDEGSLSVSGIGGYISAGGSEEGTATIQAAEDAAQHADLDYEATFDPYDAAGVGTAVDFTAEVIYPPYFDSIEAADQTLTFDEPRTEREQFSSTVPVAVENGGDQAMTLTDVAAEIDSRAVSVTGIDAPETIPALSTRNVEVSVAAETSAQEGDHAVSVTVDSETAGQETAASTVTIDHETELAVEAADIEYGRIVATRSVSQSVTIRERLGYEDVQNFQIEQISGPDNGWLTVTEQPESLAAGESVPFVTSLQFDTRATFFQQYNWTFRITGENVQTREISVSATPRPVDFTATVEAIQAAETNADQRRATVSESMATAMETLATHLRENSSSQAREDVTTVSAAGRSTNMFLEATAAARQQLDSDNNTAAQGSLTRASAAYNTLATAAEQVRTPEIREEVRTAEKSARALLTEQLAEQRADYREQLAASETTTLQQAQIYRQLSQLSALAGDKSEAAALRERSESAFEEFSTLVSDGTRNLQWARANRSKLAATTLLSVGGRPVFWIGNLDRVQATEERIKQAYTKAEKQFESAGATGRTETASSERAAFTQQMNQGRLLSFGLAGFVALGFLLLVAVEARSVYRYIQDSAEAVTGDFLLSDDTA